MREQIPVANRRLVVGTHIAVVGLSILVGGCGGEESLPTPELGSVPVITDSSQISLPLYAYQMTTDEELTLKRAEWHLALGCLTGFGVTDYDPPPLVPGLSSTSQPRRYGMLDLERATQWGYPGEDPAAAAAASAPDPSEEVPEHVAVLVAGPPDPRDPLPPGVPEGGCLGEARRQLSAGLPTGVGEDYLFQLEGMSFAQSEQDHRVKDAFARWSACMQAAGYDYDDPWQPNNHAWPRDGGVISDQERAVASADVRCKHQTNLVGIWNAVEAAYQERLIDINAELLDQLLDIRQQRLERAAQILADSG